MADEQSTTPGTPLSADQIDELFAFLWTELREAKSLFETSNNAGRDGAIHALKTITLFLMQFEPANSEASYVPLVALVNALTSLDDGEIQPILQKIKYPGRPPASAGRECFKGAVTFTVHALHATGVTLENAREQVARLLNERDVEAERGRFTEITPRTIHGWEKAVAEDVGRHHEAAQTYDLMQKEFSLVAGADPAKVKSILFKRLDHVILERHHGQKLKSS